MVQEPGSADHIVRTDSVLRCVEVRQRRSYWIGFSLVVKMFQISRY